MKLHVMNREGAPSTTTTWRCPAQKTTLLAVATLLTTACGDAAPSSPEPSTAAPCSGESCDFDMELGTGLTRFEPVEPDGSVTVSLGPQGGFHIWLAVRCQHCSEQVLIEYGVRGSADGAWLWGDPLRGITNLDPVDGWLQATGLYGLLPGSAGEIEFVGLDVTLEASIEDGERRASRNIPVHIANQEIWNCPSGDPDNCNP